MENREIPNGWRGTTLGEVAEIVMGQSPTGETCNTNGQGTPLLNGPTEFGVKSPNPVQFTLDPKKTSKKDDILFCVRGSTTGRMNWGDQEYAIGRGLAAIRHKNGNLYKYFIKALIDFNLSILLSTATGSTFPNISKPQLENMVINCPPLPEQKAIADVLSSLDEKIELLEEENKTLETLAQTIFTEWFVNFNFPGRMGEKCSESGTTSPGATGEMEDSELGEIPKGWRVGKLGEVCQIKNGFAFKSEDYETEGIPVVRTTNFDKGTIVMDNPVFLSEEKAKEYLSYFLEEFDFLLVMVGASIGKNVLVPSYILPALQNQNMWNFKSIIKEYRFYNIFLFKELIIKHSNSASGSAREFFRKDFFYNIDIVIPNEDILVKFGETVENLFRKMNINITQVQTLKSTRDTLLPKLMSGEIRVEGFGG